MACNKDHSNIQHIMCSLPFDQGGLGRHKCAACAYEKAIKMVLIMLKLLIYPRF